MGHKFTDEERQLKSQSQLRFRQRLKDEGKFEEWEAKWRAAMLRGARAAKEARDARKRLQPLTLLCSDGTGGLSYVERNPNPPTSFADTCTRFAKRMADNGYRGRLFGSRRAVGVPVRAWNKRT